MKTRNKPGSPAYIANQCARANGFARATTITYGQVEKATVIRFTHGGHVKDSNGEPVSNAYVAKCFGRGVHYRAAECDVMLPEALKPIENQEA